ncbi:uncharacterized protein V6R79_021574 [Siganus canaliculatus]
MLLYRICGRDWRSEIGPVLLSSVTQQRDISDDDEETSRWGGEVEEKEEEEEGEEEEEEEEAGSNCSRQREEEKTPVPPHFLLTCSVCELTSTASSLEDNSDGDSYNMWMDAEQERVQNCKSRSFAVDARKRLDSLKSGCGSPLPRCAMERILHNYNSQKESCESEEAEEDESALDLVELLNVEDEVQDEEKWLYESPKKQEEREESALGWCRHVLDNPSPEMEAACRSLMNRLAPRSSRNFYRRAAFLHCADSVSAGSSVDRAPMTHNTPASTDNTGFSVSHESSTTSYRLQDITDVHIMARLQEASLRGEFVSTPSTASPRRDPDSPTSGLLSLNSSSPKSPTSVTKPSCQSPKLARLHQQVTQFKLLKLAQNQASPTRTSSPLRTSLRSLQAVRNSRSLDVYDYQPDSPVTSPASDFDASSPRRGPDSWSPSSPAASVISRGSFRSVRDSSDRTAAVKRLHRSQSVSPCRIPHPAKTHLSVHGRVFASPERLSTVAWGRNAPSTQR